MRDDAFRRNDWNREHIAGHGVTEEEAEYVVNHPSRPYPEEIGDGKWRVRGQTHHGRYIQHPTARRICEGCGRWVCGTA